MLILRNGNGKPFEVSLSFSQYEEIVTCLSPEVECISCELHKEEHVTSTKNPHKLLRNKYVHVVVHMMFALLAVLSPWLLPQLHIDPSMLLGVGGLYTGAYSLFFAYRMDKEGLKVK